MIAAIHPYVAPSYDALPSERHAPQAVAQVKIQFVEPLPRHAFQASQARHLQESFIGHRNTAIEIQRRDPHGRGVYQQLQEAFPFNIKQALVAKLVDHRVEKAYDSVGIPLPHFSQPIVEILGSDERQTLGHGVLRHYHASEQQSHDNCHHPHNRISPAIASLLHPEDRKSDEAQCQNRKQKLRTHYFNPYFSILR